MREEDQLQATQTALEDWESEGGNTGVRSAEPARASPVDAMPALDPRHRRGSLGPPPAAAPLAQDASGAAFHAHLVHLLKPAPARTPDEVVTPHEDVERQPDGVPHLVIGLTALFSVIFAAVLIGVFRSGAVLGSIGAVAIALIAIPVLVFRLDAAADRDRDRDHPSR